VRQVQDLDQHRAALQHARVADRQPGQRFHICREIRRPISLQRIDRRNGRAGGDDRGSCVDVTVLAGVAVAFAVGKLVGMAVAALPDAHSNIVNQISTRPAFHIWTPSSEI